MSKRRRERRMRKRIQAQAEAIEQYQPTPEPTEPEPRPESEAVHGVVKETPKASHATKYRYGQVLPHELAAFAPLITDFYKEVDFKEAVENPAPLIQMMYNEMRENPYSIVYACVDKEMNPQGYIWFKVKRNPWGVPFVEIEHDYIIPDHRHTLTEARMHHRFIEYVVDIAERCEVQYVNTVVTNRRLELSRHKLGFKSIEVKMTFKGGASEFRAHNPSFQKYGKYEEEK